MSVTGQKKKNWNFVRILHIPELGWPPKVQITKKKKLQASKNSPEFSSAGPQILEASSGNTLYTGSYATGPWAVTRSSTPLKSSPVQYCFVFCNY